LLEDGSIELCADLHQTADGAEHTSDKAVPPPGIVLRSTRLSDVEGHAEMVHFQGRQRFLYEFNFSLGWIADIRLVDGEHRRLKGVLKFMEVGQDCDSSTYEVEAPFRPKFKHTTATDGTSGDSASMCLEDLKVAETKAQVERDTLQLLQRMLKEREPWRRSPGRAGNQGADANALEPTFQSKIIEQVHVFQREFIALPTKFKTLPSFPPPHSKKSAHGRSGAGQGGLETEEEKMKRAREQAQMQALMNDPRVKF